MDSERLARTSYHHGALRQALIDGARDILAELGHEQFSLNEVARRAGVSTSAPYRHFRDRDELLEAVAADGYATLYNCLHQVVLDTSDPADRLLRLGGAYVRFAQEHPGLFMTMFRGPGGIPDEVGIKSYEILQCAVVEAQRAELVSTGPSPELLTRSIWAALHGLSVLSLRQLAARFGMDGPPEELAAGTLSALLGLREPGT
ncbi:TetR/AcrR family transcriptional regulator [Streptomyces chartreusis]|uniref:TetR/AcrR family transcriptional regulator n=1 Tax=Streptomyces chartreusis TaxID=1969 RepID=UPI002F90A52A|nr:TetR/AcrR family transcriptional regulator [Streptomyces chartreusis]